MKYLVEAQYGRTSTTYYFGPFDSEDEAELFAQSVWLSDRVESYPAVYILNDHTDFGTGMEMA